MGTMRPSWEIAPYFAFIDTHFLIRQAPISLTIAKHGRVCVCKDGHGRLCTHAPLELGVLPCWLVGNQNSYQFPISKDNQYVLMDRDTNFSCAFRTILDDAGVEPVRLPAKIPNLNAHLERFHLSIKSECLSRMIFFGGQSLRRAVNTYLMHYHRQRNHQGLENRIIDPGEEVGQSQGEVRCDEHLGGMLKYYFRKAA